MTDTHVPLTWWYLAWRPWRHHDPRLRDPDHPPLLDRGQWRHWMVPHGNATDVALLRGQGAPAITDEAHLTLTLRNRLQRSPIAWHYLADLPEPFDAICEPAAVYRNVRTAYYWKSSALRLMVRSGRLPRRPRCAECQQRRPDVWSMEDAAFEWWRTTGFCSLACQQRAVHKADLTNRRNRRELAWLNEGRRTLRNIRAWIRDQQRSPISRGASTSRRRASVRATISPT